MSRDDANSKSGSSGWPTRYFSVKKYDENIGLNDTSLSRSEGLRGANDGILNVHYSAATDTISLRASEDISGTGEGVYDNVASLEYAGFKNYVSSNFSTDLMKVYLGGGSDGAVVAAGEAYFSDFNINYGVTSNGTITPIATPEPISCTLFLLGGGLLAGVRKLKKK